MTYRTDFHRGGVAAHAFSHTRARLARRLGRSFVRGRSRSHVAILCAAAVALSVPALTPPAAGAGDRPKTTIQIFAGTAVGTVPPGQLGVNHRFVANGYGVWDVQADAPEPLVVRRLRRAGVTPVRFPGGTMANLFDWKDSIGEQRGCQTNGKMRATGFAAARSQAYGLDEHMELVEAAGAQALIMVPFATETPADAADWVEYMNTPAGDARNPNGGVDWAEVRAANGHPSPYRVRAWEIGNEQRVKTQRYWMAGSDWHAVRQYAFGGYRDIHGELLGRNCNHPSTGVPSNGAPGQVFELLYPPATLADDTVTVGDEEWYRVPDLSVAEPEDKVFEFDPAEGEVRFGDGINGAVPGRGMYVSASYRSTHQGFFAFARAMKAVDPTIDVCATWGLKPFIRLAGRRNYDCFSVHSYAHFDAVGGPTWRSPLDGHDEQMVSVDREVADVMEIERALPSGVRLVLTEYGALNGDTATYPEWSSSMSHTAYMATMWARWLMVGVPYVVGNALTSSPNPRGLLGRAPDFVFTAEAVARQAVLPMFRSGGRPVLYRVSGNPVRTTRAGRYGALSVAVTRGRDRAVYALVVNRNPRNGVRATVDLGRFTTRRVAQVRRVTGSSFRSWNIPGETGVRLHTWRRRTGKHRFVHTFPAHSVTVLRIPSR